jgi:hypothetical protein
MVLTGLGAAVAVAGYDLITGWEVPSSGLADAVAIGLLVFAVATCIALLAFSGDERQMLAGDADFLKVLGVAARGVRWSSAFAIGLSILLFANCSAAVSSGDMVSGATTNPSQFWPLAALEMLPLVVAIAVPAGLATAAHKLASKGRLRQARKVASLGLWSPALVAVVALATAGIAFFGGVSECFYVSTASTCAAGVGGLVNPIAIASLLVIVPYLALIKRALASAAADP